MSYAIHLPGELNERTLNEFFLACADISGLSDLLFQSDDYVFAKIDNVQTRITERRLDPTEVDLICAIKYGKSAVGVINAGEDLNFRCEVQRTLNDVVSFRANATRGRVGDLSDGISITARFITEIPRQLESLGLQ